MTARVVKKRGIEEQSSMPPVIPYWPGYLIPKRMGKRILLFNSELPDGKGPGR